MQNMFSGEFGGGPAFTLVEHLRVQQQIGKRANKFWFAGGCHPDAALENWLRAEREVLERFIEAYARRRSYDRPRRRPGFRNPFREREQSYERRPGISLDEPFQNLPVQL